MNCFKKAFNHLLDSLTSDCVLAYFDKSKMIEVLVGASPVSISAILAQRTTNDSAPKVVAYICQQSPQ